MSRYPHALGRRLSSSAIFLCAWVGTSAVLAAEDFPDKPIRLIVPFAAGGTTDLVARSLAERMGAALGQLVQVDNRAGAGGAIGTDAVVKARPDGYTIGMATASTHEFTPACNKDVRYHPVNDFEMLGLVATTPSVVFVKADSKLGSLADVLAASRANPGTTTWGTPGVCSNTHFLVALVNKNGGGQIAPVPYRANNLATVDLVAGRLTLASDGVSAASALMSSGAVRPIAIIGTTTVGALRNVSSFRDQGVDIGQFQVWQGLVAPAKTPSVVLARLNAALRSALADAKLQQRWLDDGITPSPDPSPATMKAQVQAGFESAQKLAGMLQLSTN